MDEKKGERLKKLDDVRPGCGFIIYSMNENERRKEMCIGLMHGC